MFNNILVAVDGSADADRALAQAIDLAESEHTRLTVITAVADLATAAYLVPGAPVGTLTEDARAEAERTLQRARDRIPSELPVTTVLANEPIRTALISQIKNGHYDLVVIGSRGRGAIRSTLLGSVSHYALHHSHIPVLIVHSESPPGIESIETAA